MVGVVQNASVEMKMVRMSAFFSGFQSTQWLSEFGWCDFKPIRSSLWCVREAL